MTCFRRLFAAQLILNQEPDVDEANGENVTALNESSSHEDESANTVGNQDEETDANAMLNSHERCLSVFFYSKMIRYLLLNIYLFKMIFSSESLSLPF